MVSLNVLYLTLILFSDRRFAEKWILKLKDQKETIVIMQLRNKIMSALITQIQTRHLTAPFNSNPNFRKLEDVPIPDTTPDHLLTDQLRLPQIMRQSPDQGAFLVSQPVPKCGAFCYLAVVSRPPNH
jgi:hypothetical protein